MTQTQIEVIRSGDWLPADEQIGNMLAALEKGGDVCIDLAGVDYLDAGSLQTLLALTMYQKEQGAELQLLHLSAPLRDWLDCAGAGPYLQSTWSGNA